MIEREATNQLYTILTHYRKSVSVIILPAAVCWNFWGLIVEGYYFPFNSLSQQSLKGQAFFDVLNLTILQIVDPFLTAVYELLN